MRWPLMFRSTHDALLEAERTRGKDREDTIADIRAELATLRERETALMDQYVKLATPKPTPVVADREPDAVAEAIRRRGGSAALRSHLAFWARQMRAAEPPMADEEIVASILDWSRAEQPDTPF